jgi:hypothetical protein
VEGWLAALEATSLAQSLRMARWAYAGINAAHILGVALLIGAIVPLNLRFFGLWPSVPLEHLARVLVPVALGGLLLAVSAGALLFATRATEYAALGVFQVKMALVLLGTAAALSLHATHAAGLADASRRRLLAHGTVSTVCWIGALVCGRVIAFVAD